METSWTRTRATRILTFKFVDKYVRTGLTTASQRIDLERMSTVFEEKTAYYDESQFT